MRKLLLLCIAVFLLGTWANDFVRHGQLEKFLDAHPNPQVNPKVEYYLAVLVAMANRNQSAESRFRRIREVYPDSAFAPLAWAELIELFDDAGNRNVVLAESTAFLDKYPNHSRADLIRKKILFIQHGY